MVPVAREQEFVVEQYPGDNISGRKRQRDQGRVQRTVAQLFEQRQREFLLEKKPQVGIPGTQTRKYSRQ